MRQILKLFSGLGLAAALLAQQPPPFAIKAQQGQNLLVLSDGGTLTFSSEGIGQPLSGTVTLTYTGSSTSSINVIDSVGSTDFTVNLGALSLPLNMNPGDSLTVGIGYNPTALGKVTGAVRFNFTEGRRTAAVTVNLVGVQPDFGFSFIVLPKGNVTSISPAGAITFPDTTVNLANPTLNQTNSAVIIITNRGSGPGTVNNITSTGAAFSLSGVPLLPAVAQPNADVRFTVIFSPTQLVASAGTVKIDFVGRSVGFNLAGAGVGSVYAYEFAAGSSTRPINNNDTLVMPQANLGDKSTAVVRVRNTGNADGAVNKISISGADFTIPDLPFLPQTLSPGGSISFTIQFAPTQPIAETARLLVDNVTFTVSGTGLGVTLTYAVTVGSATATITNNGSVIFTPTRVGETSSARLQINNTGNAPTFINSVSATGPTSVAGSVFSVANVPGLPVKVDGGSSVSFDAVFAPIVTGAATGTLKVDNTTFNLSGAGSDPPALPLVSFPGAGGASDAAQQVAVGVTLARAYPVNLTGRLLLTFTSDVFADDPAIQFATGGRTVAFFVPANRTQAVFGVDQTQVRLQSGTVAGTITLAATFATEAGAINLTPSVVPASTIRVNSSAPRIRSVQLSARTTTGFTLLITGYAPSRSVTGMAFQFTAFVDPENKDLKLDTTSLNLNVDGPFNAWYQSTPSVAFGSLFTATVTFNVRGDIDAIQSASVTISNTLGASGAVSVNLR